VGTSHTNDQGEVAEEYVEAGTVDKDITDEDVEMALLMRMNPREHLYREAAVAMGYDAGFFKEHDRGVVYTNKARKMLPEEGDKFKCGRHN